VADHMIMQAMGWRAGIALTIRVTTGVIVVTVGDGGYGVTRQGHLRLPATVRRTCRIEPGDRVLLAADPAEGVVIVHPPASLDRALAQLHAKAIVGEVA